MGKSESKPKPAEEPPAVDNREPLSRHFGEKYTEYWTRMDALNAVPLEERLKRPVHSSVYWRDLAWHQGFWTHFGILFLIMRKLPFTNPAVRVSLWIIGVDLCRSRSKYLVRLTEDDLNEFSTFYMLRKKLTTWTALRIPDFHEEDEDWHLLNKPAYRTPVGLEFSGDAVARFLFVNYPKFKERNVKWHGEWEQENALVMDLAAPHSDHWLTHH
jgi:hypothetical protein